MKTRLIILFTFLLAQNTTFAQSPIGKGGSQLNVGVGFSSWGIPLYCGFDYGVHKDVTVGGEASFRSYHDDYYNNSYKHSIFGLSGNGNYHFNTLLNIQKSWDVYAGLNLGFYFWSSSDNYPGNSSSGVGLGAQVGGRYYINEKLGLNLEFGGGNTFSGGKFGLTIKL